MAIEDIRKVRLEKLEKIKAKGIDPYPAESHKTHYINEAISDFDNLQKNETKITIAGRVMSLRGQGAIIFSDIFDGTGKFQALFKRDEMSEKDFDFWNEVIDMGDFVEVTGKVFVTKRGERTLQVESWNILSKSLLPLPEKWHGLQDTDERFRKRYLDTLMDENVRNRFVVRSKIITAIRDFYNKEGFLEVETPRLQALAGGATALPFITHHNALDTDFYLTIAQELYLKELLVGGFNKVYEIGRKFRNEGIDVTHNPEFTMLESNEAYSDAKGQMIFIEHLFQSVVQKVFGKNEFVYEEETVIIPTESFERITFYDLLKKYAGLSNPEKITRDEAKEIAEKQGSKVSPSDGLEKILDYIYKKACRPKIIQPLFIVDYPVAFNPFAKRKEYDKTLIDRFQLVIGGLEVVNAFSELNNPIDQKERYEEQDKKKKQGDGEISPNDQTYLDAMEYGMPPNGGIGIGIDRLVMLLTNTKNIKEVIFFPTMKPKDESGQK